MANKKKTPSVAELFFKLINFIFIIFALAIILFSLLNLIKWKHDSSDIKPNAKDQMLSSKDWFSDSLPTPWFVYFVMGYGAAFLLVTFIGFIGTGLRSSCCLSFYFVLLLGFILSKLGLGAVMVFGQKKLKDLQLPEDKTGTLLSTYQFYTHNWTTIRWAHLAVLAIEVVAFSLAVYLTFVYKSMDDIEDERYVIYTDHPAPPKAKAKSKSKAAQALPLASREVKTQTKQTPNNKAEAAV